MFLKYRGPIGIALSVYKPKQKTDIEHGAFTDAIKKGVKTVKDIWNTPLFTISHTPNRIKADDGSGGYWVLQKKEVSKNKRTLTCTYKHSITGELHVVKKNSIR